MQVPKRRTRVNPAINVRADDGLSTNFEVGFVSIIHSSIQINLFALFTV